ncbi:MBL fold metallo-hydrolase [Streptomyces sp. NBC_00859]|uniref:MBL fold metallo-hydrolase n=1 Tax=Streptomyces sp. NBC_00859 TaxID=2903682 RepID=UPI003864CC3B|nr:MBL fold metallo-hydrolase [Streptomyces sp. NBC_00859]WSZ86706.1 MBL fold metallo-hydrolase [Streptomyces sp. NBC_00859]
MKITFLGHAGALIEAGDVRLVCDPWFSPRGAFLSGWHQLPDNSACTDLLTQATHVYVSHDHEDHFDTDVLRGLDESVELISANYPLPSWHRLVEGLGHTRTTLLDDGQTLRAGQLLLHLITSPTARHQDSALIVQDTVTGEVVVNLNDCQTDRDQLRALRRRHPRIDVVLAQYSGATWYPFVYEFPAGRQRELAAAKKVNSMRRWADYMKILRPRTAVAFAGPPALLDPDLRTHSRGPGSIFTTPVELQQWLQETDPGLAERCVAPLPGDVLDVTSSTMREDPGIRRDFAWDRLEEYTARYAKRRAPDIQAVLSACPEPTQDLYPAFAAHFEALFAVAPKACAAVDCIVGFDIRGTGGGQWSVDFTTGQIQRDEHTPPSQHDYRFTLESRFVPGILRGERSWEEFFFSFRFQAWRPSVNAYNEELMSLLSRSDPQDLAVYCTRMEQARGHEPGSFRLTTANGDLEISNTCPHMGALLGPEDYDPRLGAIVCPRHSWQFTVPDGTCANGRATLDIHPPTHDQAS